MNRQTAQPSLANNFHKLKSLFIVAMLSLISIQSVDAQNQNITEQVLYSGISQGDKSFKFYTLQITTRYFTGQQSLAFKVVSEAFDSDPDIFISKTNQQPKSAADSQWYCMKSGSDTCIVKRTDINYGDNFYIGVRCNNPCHYSLRAIYAPVTTLTEGTRTQVRFDGYSSNIFEYYVPSDAKTGSTLGATITIESENPYSPIDMYFSVDDDLYQIEEKKQGQIIQNGKAYFFNSDDYDWCTRCYVYILVDVIDTGRYYVTGTASARNDVLTTSTATQRIINTRSQECYQYFVQKQENDLQIQVYQYQGDAEVYISPRNIPSSLTDTSNVKLTSERSPWRSLIATSKDRARYGSSTGLYYICLYGYVDTSAQILLSETNYNYRYDAVDDMLYTIRLENAGYVYYRYTTSDFVVRTNINLKLQAFNLTNGAEPPKIFYKVCSSQTASDCYLEVTEAQGKATTMQEVGTYNGTTRTGTIYHDPSVCMNVNSCYYLISVFYPQSNGPMKVSFKIAHDNQDPTDAQIGNQYRNIKREGSYEFYELLPGSSDGYPYTEAVIIDLQSFMGDGEIYVSTANRFPTAQNYTFRSVEFGDTRDKIILNRTSYFTLNRPIYISVFAYTQVAYEMSISAVYSPTYNAQLEKAIPLADGVSVYQSYSTEYQEGFFSFHPWWPANENRTMVFVGDVFYNNIFFYMQKNDFPMFFLTEWKDNNDVIAISANDAGYDLKSKYYIRVRPDFALYDLISTKQYLFNFYAFTQLPTNQFQDLQHNEKIMGYANGTQQFYRYLIQDKTSTIVITVNPIQGNPRLLVKVANTPLFTNSSNVYSYDYKSDNAGKATEQLNITYTQRLRNSADCDLTGYAQNGGQKLCNLYIGVECPFQCVYNITIQVQGKESTTTFQPPRYLTEHNFYTGNVKYNETKYFYYPIHANNTGEMAIFLNKTGPLLTNGDSMLLVSLQNDTTLPYEKWNYPTLSKAHIMSYANSSTQPELVEICSQTFAARCQNSSCALVIGVLGVSKTATSQFRLNTYKQSTKLINKSPITGTIEQAGQYHYYWFVNNITVTKPNATWEYVVAVSTFNKTQDVDLYVSAMDGRAPSSDDNDWFSDNVGPDDVYITNNDNMFAMKNWNTSNGVLFVVGVKALTDNTSYSLMMSGPNRYSVQLFDLNTTVIQTRTFNNNTLASNNTHSYKWFNWGHRDFRIQIDGLVGNVYMFLNHMDEETYTNNAFLALPYNVKNSKYTQMVNASQSYQLKIFKTDADFCYYCWYYLTIYTNTTNANSSYRISMTEIADAGDDIPMITVGDPNSLQLPATGSVAQRKFLLDTKNPFTIQMTLATGYAIVYVGLYPDAPLTKYAWKSEGGIGTINIRVRTTDPNFHIGTYYYVTMQATQGRATISLKVTQNKEISQLDNYVSKKDLYWTNEERVKLYFFKVPINNFTVKVNVDALSEDFYPTLYLWKNNMTSKPADFRTLQYPTLKNYSLALGDNFSTLANKQMMTYIFSDKAVTNFTYYTMALYDFSYGMTDRRKAEFRISLEILSTSNFTNSSTVIVSEEQFINDLPEQTLYEKMNEWFSSTYAYYDNMIKDAVNSFSSS